MATYNWRVCSASSISTSFDFSKAVDSTHVEPVMAPIDQFIEKNYELNKMLLDPNNFGTKISSLHGEKKVSNKSKQALELALFDTSSISPVFANLVLLGHISVVESYFRAIFRKLILIDETTQKTCYEKELIYGAVLVHERDSLPDALLELISFSSKKNIEDSLRNFFGIKGQLPTGLDPILTEFSKICQLRHCIIHKFGTLGSNNIKHDIYSNKPFVNKPIKTNFSTIQEVSQICWNVVNEINHLLWQNTMMRTIADFEKKWTKKPNTMWTWNWGKDKAKFRRYYSIFSSSLAPPGNIKSKDAYLDLKNIFAGLQ